VFSCKGSKGVKGVTVFIEFNFFDECLYWAIVVKKGKGPGKRRGGKNTGPASVIVSCFGYEGSPADLA
jgi:hypothetical protein